MKSFVKMTGTVVTDGNPEEIRRKTVTQMMDRSSIDELIAKPTLAEAVDFFVSNVHYLDYVTAFEFFEIDGEKYFADDWQESALPPTGIV